MIRSEIFKILTSHNRRIFILKHYSSQINIEKLEKDQGEIEVIDKDQKQKEEELEKKRNKSRLKEHHREFLMEKNPYPEPMFWHHGTIKYMRRTYGRYGLASGINPEICWPVKNELEESLEYERVAHPFTILQMVESVKKERIEKSERILKRQKEIVNKMEKSEQWKQELYDRIAKKETIAFEAKQRKERLIEEVRRHFGYTVDPRDERFQEMLQKKEKEQKKAMKEAKRKAKEDKLVEKLFKKKNEDKNTNVSVLEKET